MLRSKGEGCCILLATGAFVLCWIASSSAVQCFANMEAGTVRPRVRSRQLDQFYDYSLASESGKQVEVAPLGEWDGAGESASGGGDGDNEVYVTYGDTSNTESPTLSSYGDSSFQSDTGDTPSYGGYAGTDASSYGGGYSNQSSGASAWGSNGASSYHPSMSSLLENDKQVSLLTAMAVSLLLMILAMLFTAYQFQSNPDGHFAQCCRLTLHTGQCVCTLFCKLYLCRLKEIPPVVSAVEDEEEENALSTRMKLRPGLARALDVEHGKIVRKNEIELKLVDPTPSPPSKNDEEKPKKKKKKRKKLSYVG